MKTSRVAPAALAFVFSLVSLGWLVQPGATQASPRSFAGQLLDAHNTERTSRGLDTLEWSGKLAREAQVWADELARSDHFRHAPPQARGSTGENLWAGSKGYYGAHEMIGTFLAEKKYFKKGYFPEVSTTGKWADVGHYTQIIWPSTKQVGCAVAPGKTRDYLVCRYYPAGNIYGLPVG